MVIKMGTDATGGPTGFSVVWFSRILAIYYYAYFLLILPLLGFFEKTLPVPANISTPVLSGGMAMPVGAVADAEKKG